MTLGEAVCVRLPMRFDKQDILKISIHVQSEIILHRDIWYACHKYPFGSEDCLEYEIDGPLYKAIERIEAFITQRGVVT